jgi:hypothetical protein
MFSKLWVALFGAAILTVAEVIQDDVFTWGDDGIKVASAIVGAFLVWLTANGPVGTGWHYAKSIAYGVSAVLAMLALTLTGGINTREWVELAIVFLTAAGVLAVRGAPTHP